MVFVRSSVPAIYYEGANADQIPASLPRQSFLDTVGQNCVNVCCLWPTTMTSGFCPSCPDSLQDPLEKTVPSFPIASTPHPDATFYLNMSLTINSTGHTLYQMNVRVQSQPFFPSRQQLTCSSAEPLVRPLLQSLPTPPPHYRFDELKS